MSHSKYKTKIKSEVLNFIDNNYNKSLDIKKFCDNLLVEIQKEFIVDPPMYMTLLEDKRSDVEVKYTLTAKTHFPIGINKTKEIRIYVGRIDEFPKGTKDERGKVIGKMKLIERLKREINV